MNNGRLVTFLLSCNKEFTTFHEVRAVCLRVARATLNKKVHFIVNHIFIKLPQK